MSDLQARLDAAERAVKYVLDRAQSDPDLYYEIGWGSQAFHLLTVAEARATGDDLAVVESRRRQTSFTRPRRGAHPEPRAIAREQAVVVALLHDAYAVRRVVRPRGEPRVTLELLPETARVTRDGIAVDVRGYLDGDHCPEWGRQAMLLSEMEAAE